MAIALEKTSAGSLDAPNATIGEEESLQYHKLKRFLI